MARPLVAVVGRRADRVPILRFSATLAAEAMCEAVWAAGGEPVILHGPARAPLAELHSRLANFDGLLLPGGADIEPSRYGAEPAPETHDTVSFQDDLDLGVIRAVMQTGMPTLAVCRGMQILNVALGGTLVQHVAETVHHNAVHQVSVVPGSRLHAIVGALTVEVSSYHHQAVDVLAPGLIVAGVAADGIVEAVEQRGERHGEHCAADIVAVQWHPEDRHSTSDTDAALFWDLVDRARKRKDSR